MSVEISMGLTALVNRSPIPNQNQRSGHMTLQMFKHFNHLRTFHASAKMAFVQLARQGQADGGGKTAPFILHAAQNRALAARRPGAGKRFLKREPKFIEKHDFCAASSRFF